MLKLGVSACPIFRPSLGIHRKAYSPRYLEKTVRKVPPGSELKPHKYTTRSKKPNSVAPGTKNVGFSGYSSPFSDSFLEGVFSEVRSNR